jgi:hypothetical protein
LEKWARLSDLPRKSLSQDAVLRRQVFLEEMGETSLIVDKRGKALGNLAILRIEELAEHRGDGLLLGCNMRFELLVDVSQEGFADVL